MQASMATRNCARVLAVLAAMGCIVAITACSHVPPAGAGAATTAAKDDDPWVVRGSVSGGPILGNPVGPYSPRP
jgi:hypothetical protein